MPSFKRSCEIIKPEAVTPLPEIEILTPIRNDLPQHIEKLIKQNGNQTPKTVEKSSTMKQSEIKTPKIVESSETPKHKHKVNNVTKFKLRRRILYEEVTNVTKIVETRKIESPKRIEVFEAKTPRFDFHNSVMINPPVSLKSRRQMYMQSRFSEKRQQRKQFELKRRAMSHDQMLFHFRDIIMDNLLSSEF